MSTGRKHKEYLARRVALGGSTTVAAEPFGDLIRATHERMSYCAMGRHLGLAHSYLRAIAVGKIKRISPENAQTIAALRRINQPVDTSHVNATGTIRRLRALHALGYTWRSLAEECNYSLTGLKSTAYGKWPVVEARNAESVRVAYERLSMRLPVGDTPHARSSISSARNSSKARGWMPPLAWDDIDRDETRDDRPLTGLDPQLDPIVVERILDGDMSLAASATKGERVEVVARWQGSLAELERLTGWRPDRYRKAAA